MVANISGRDRDDAYGIRRYASSILRRASLSRIGRKSFGIAVAVALAAGALMAPSPAVAGPDPCGPTVEYASWRWISESGTWVRSWYYSYYNCSVNSVKRKVALTHAPDRPCKTIAGHGYMTYNGLESRTVPFPAMNGYDGTVNC
jgi:hypothetical protein